MEPYPNPDDEFKCTPNKLRRPTRQLDYIAPPGGEFPTNCAGREDLCAVVKKTAINREVLVAVCNSGIINQLSKWVESNRRANIENMMIVAIDAALPKWLEDNKVAYWRRETSAAGSHKISAQKFQYVREFLTIGCSVLMSDIDVVYLQNPFHFLHHDSDVEGTTDGWDNGSAYGWTERLDDPSLGAAGRFRPSMRITAWNSGLWYIAATRAGLRMMSILAHRMATEDTWDQAAFGEEMSRPARDDHLAAGMSKRALNHWCFCNSKTLFRRIRVESRFAEHRPVVVHANYHQPKPPRMAAVYDRWHLNQRDALDRFSGEQAFTVPAPELERDFLHMINDGFVSGANTRDASNALAKGSCSPQRSKHTLAISLHTRPRSACADGDALCHAAASVARVGPSHGPNGGGGTGGTGGGGKKMEELVVVMGSAAQVEEMRLMLKSARNAKVTALLLILTEQAAADALGNDLPPAAPTKFEGTPAADGSGGGPRSIVLTGSGADRPLGARIAKFDTIGRLLAQGFGVLYAAPPTLFLRDPFASLYRDADVEAMSLGWDDGSAYGYNHVLDDPSMGFTRFCHGSRIVGYNPGFFYSMPTAEAVALTARMAERLRRAEGAEGRLTASSTAAAVDDVERIEFVHELWLPSHHDYASVGAVLRVMNYLCFVNSKVLFRQLRNLPSTADGSPVALQMDYHSDTLSRMVAALARFVEGRPSELRELPLADANDAKTASGGGRAAPLLGCARSGRTGSSATKLGAHLIRNSPYAWGGVGDMVFEEEGVLSTPWGKGEWGVHPADESPATAVYADFVGAKHNVRFDLSTGMGVSTRCNDNNVVLVRSIKAAKAKLK